MESSNLVAQVHSILCAEAGLLDSYSREASTQGLIDSGPLGSVAGANFGSGFRTSLDAAKLPYFTDFSHGAGSLFRMPMR